MVMLKFTNDKTYYHYGPGVNAQNMTKADIDEANVGLAPKRERLIETGKVKRTSSDKPPQNNLKIATGSTATGNATATRNNTTSKHGTSKYATWTRQELRKALIDKRIMKDEAIVRRMTKEQRAALLVKADQRPPKFKRFLDLSPEMRNRIYGFALADVKEEHPSRTRVRPTPPSLCQVNRQIRMESVGLFFNGLTISFCVTGKQALSPAEFSHKDRAYAEHAFKHGYLTNVRSFQWIVQGHSVDRRGLASNWWAQRFRVNFSPGMDRLETKATDAAMRAHLKGITDDLKKITAMPGRRMTRKKFNTMLDVFLARF